MRRHAGRRGARSAASWRAPLALLVALPAVFALVARAGATAADAAAAARPRAALVYLSSSKPKHARLFAQSVRHLQRHFNGAPGRQYPVLVFHDGLDRRAERFHREAARGASPAVADLRVVRATKFVVPRNVDRGEMAKHIAQGPDVVMRSEGYRTMIRWWSGPVFHEPALADFDYMWRFDTDSFLITPPPYDLFRDMAERRLVYGYRAVCPENKRVARGLSEVVDRWAHRELGFAVGARPRTLADAQDVATRAPGPEGGIVDRWRLDGGAVYYTNFELLDLRFFRAREYTSLFEACDAEAGFHHRRWGDALVRTHGVDLLVPANATAHYIDVDYLHAEYTDRPFYLGAGVPGCWTNRRWLDLANGWPLARGHLRGAAPPPYRHAFESLVFQDELKSRGAAHGKALIAQGQLHVCNETGCALEAGASCDPCTLFAPYEHGFRLDASLGDPLPSLPADSPGRDEL